MKHKQSYDEVLEAIVAGDPRYHRDAYHFVRDGLDYTQRTISEQEDGAVRHISGQELLGGIRAHALKQYGPMVLTVLGEWGVSNCEDFGAIVFNMVEHELLAKTEDDSADDFTGGYDFKEAFLVPFLPPEPIPETPAATERNITPIADTEPNRSQNSTEPKASKAPDEQ
jgi:uncharacterized repeat protein (TIGR04138 family)